MKTIWIVICFVIAAFVVPIIINWVYSTNYKIFFTEWDATNALLYWGSVLGGLATLLAIYINLLAEKRKERYRVISGLLSNALRNFDILVFLDINKYGDDYYGSRRDRCIRDHSQPKKVCGFILPDTIPSLIEKAQSNMFLGIEFLSHEKSFFNRVLNDLNELTKDYIASLQILEEQKDSELRFAMGNEKIYWLDNFLENSKGLCRKYNEVSTSVEKRLTEYESR
jgi:hypothetical protein